MSKNPNASEALLIASMNGDTTAILAAISGGADIEAIDNQTGFTALMLASEQGHTETVFALLECGANFNARRNGLINESTALMYASKKGHTKIVLALRERGADIEAKNKTGETALMMASEEGHTETVLDLLDGKAKIDAKDENGKTALMWASNGKTVSALLNGGAKIDATDNFERTALMWASRIGNTEAAVTLLNGGAKIDAQDYTGKTALMWASSGKTVSALLNGGAKIDATDKEGKTALMWASEKGHKEAVNALFKKLVALYGIETDQDSTPEAKNLFEIITAKEDDISKHFDRKTVTLIAVAMPEDGRAVADGIIDEYNARRKDNKPPIRKAGEGGPVDILRTLKSKLDSESNKEINSTSVIEVLLRDENLKELINFYTSARASDIIRTLVYPENNSSKSNRTIMGFIDETQNNDQINAQASRIVREFFQNGEYKKISNPNTQPNAASATPASISPNKTPAPSFTN